MLLRALGYESKKVYHKATSRSGAIARSKQHGDRNQKTIRRSTVQLRRKALGISCRLRENLPGGPRQESYLLRVKDGSIGA